MSDSEVEARLFVVKLHTQLEAVMAEAAYGCVIYVGDEVGLEHCTQAIQLATRKVKAIANLSRHLLGTHLTSIADGVHEETKAGTE